MMPLNTAVEGKCVRILKLECGRMLRSQLNNQGLYVGEVIKIIRNSRGHLVVAKGHARLALGRGMSHKIFVETIEESQCRCE